MVKQKDDELACLWQDILSELSEASPQRMNEQVFLTTVETQLQQAALTRNRYHVAVGDILVYLTARERQVLYWVCQALSATEIAQRVELSPRTVEYYTSNLKAKFHVFSKQSLVKLIEEKTAFMEECARVISQ